MKICFVCSEYPFGPHGGIGTVTQILARALTLRGHDVRVIGVYPPSYPAPDFEENQGVRVWRLRERSCRYLGWIITRRELFRAISRWVANGEIDLIEVPDYQGWAAQWSQLHVPVVARFHGSASLKGNELHRRSRKIDHFLERSSLQRAEYLCSVSQYLAKYTRKLFMLDNRAVSVIYNPIEVGSNFPERHPISGKVVFMGTLNENKGVIRLLSAWNIVKQSWPNAELHIFGKDWRMEGGSSMREFLDLRYGDVIQKQVCFHGFVQRNILLDHLRGAAVVVLPSRVEGLGMTALEAMAMGCPTIFTRRASGPEIIKDGHDGLLIDPDNPQEIANATIRILQDNELADRLGRAGWEKVRNSFSSDIIIPKNEEFYAECIERFRNAESNKGWG